MVKVSVVILNWNGYEDTSECLKSVINVNTSKISLSIIVVDNGSTDSSLQKIKAEYVNKGITFIEAKSNLGFAGGNNVGIKRALDEGSSYVLVLNNDTRVDRNSVSELVSDAENNPRAGLFSPMIYFEEGYEFHKDRYSKGELGKVVWSAGGSFDWRNIFGVNRGLDEVDEGQYEDGGSIEFATGAALFARAEMLKKIGTFDERYFLYFEDCDLSMRARKFGWGIRYVPKSFIWHRVSQSSAVGSSLNDYYISRNRMFFGLKYAPVRSKLALLKESFKLLTKGREWQKIGIRDFYLRNFGKGSYR